MSVAPEALARLMVENDDLFEELIAYQKKRVADVAAQLNPRLTSEDLLNPHDYPELQGSWRFQYEDGMLNGYIAAQVAWRARILGQARTLLHEAGWGAEAGDSEAGEQDG